MILLLLGGLTLLVSYVLYWRCSVEERAIRWELYRLRDELRNRAFENKGLLTSEVFTTLDSRLTMYCAHLNELSLWTILPTMLVTDRKRMEGRQRDFMAKLEQPKNAVLRDVYEQSTNLLARHLMWRHMFLTTLAAVTVFLIVLCNEMPRWLSQRMLSGALRPESAIPGLSRPMAA